MRLLRVAEVASILATSTPRVYALIRDGLLPAVRLGRQVRVAPDVLEEWIRTGGQALPGGWRRESEGDGERSSSP